MLLRNREICNLRWSHGLGCHEGHMQMRAAHFHMSMTSWICVVLERRKHSNLRNWLGESKWHVQEVYVECLLAKSVESYLGYVCHQFCAKESHSLLSNHKYGHVWKVVQISYQELYKNVEYSFVFFRSLEFKLSTPAEEDIFRSLMILSVPT